MSHDDFTQAIEKFNALSRGRKYIVTPEATDFEEDDTVFFEATIEPWTGSDPEPYTVMGAHKLLLLAQQDLSIQASGNSILIWAKKK